MKKPRRRLRAARRHAPRRGVPQGAFPDHPRALPEARHRHHARADPGGAGGALHLRRRRHRPAKAAPTCPACTPSARPPTPGCMAPTGWRAIRCSNAWCSAAPARSTSSQRARPLGRRLPAVGREPGRERRRAGRDRAQLGRAAPADVELRRHRAHDQAAASARCTASSCCAARSTTTTPTSASRATCSSCATWSIAPS